MKQEDMDNYEAICEYEDGEDYCWCDIIGGHVLVKYCESCTECAELAEEHWLADKLLSEPFDD